MPPVSVEFLAEVVFRDHRILAALLVLRAVQLPHSLGDLVSTVPSTQPHCDCVPLAGCGAVRDWEVPC